MSESLEDRETELSEFVIAIENHLKKYRSYSFRTVSIDGVLCYPVIHKYRKIVNFECVNIECKITNSQGYSVKEKYSVYHKSYKTIRNAILIVENVIATFRIVDGDLVSADEFKICILERKFNPYQEHQICCICYENTMDITECEHYLCLKCRESCIRKKKLDCPICRKKEGVVNYNIDNGLINNVVYKCIKDINEYERTGKKNIIVDEEEAEVITLREVHPRDFTITAYIDRIGTSGRARSQSSEDLNYLPHGTILDDDLSEVPTLDSNDSEDMPLYLDELFEE
jgi:hypothetical protein